LVLTPITLTAHNFSQAIADSSLKIKRVVIGKLIFSIYPKESAEKQH